MNSPLQARWAGHSCRRAPDHRTQCPCNVEQFTGVVRPTRPKPHHVVIARALAFVAQRSARYPYERVEPVERSHDPGEQVDSRIAATDVRQLVAEDDANSIAGPIRCPARQEDFGTPHSSGDEQSVVMALEQEHVSPDVELGGDVAKRVGPPRIDDRRCARGDPGEPDEADGQFSETNERADRPDPFNDARERQSVAL